MSKFTKYFSMTMVAVLFLGMFYILTPHAYAATNLAIVNPLDGTNSFEFTTAELPVGGTFAINLTVIGVTDLATWQARVGWDPAFLEFVSFVFPSDDVFFNKSPIRAPTDNTTTGSMLAGAVAGPGAGSFTGTGTLGVLTLKILDGADSTCPIQYTNLGSDTFLLDINGNDIVFTLINGVYTLTKVAAGKPSFKLQPSPIAPLKKGDTFTVDVMVSGVDSSAEIVAFQFSIMWDTTLMTPTAFANGSFLETFQYDSLGVIYATDINAHNRPPPDNPIADGYNYSTVGEILMPDDAAGNTFHAPFPTGSGSLGTFYFTAIKDTTPPETPITSSIKFIPEDFLVLSASGENVGYRAATDAVYNAPVKVLGVGLDLYTQWPEPWGGQGVNKTSDSFGPQQGVELCANLTYNDFGVPGKLVTFVIIHKDSASGVTFNFTRVQQTDANGRACITFRIPWTGLDSTGNVSGWWYVTAISDLLNNDGTQIVEQLRFYVWWLVEVTEIGPKYTTAQPSFTQKSGGKGDLMNFNMTYLTHHMQPLPVLLQASAFDELNFTIGTSEKSFELGGADDYTNVPIDSWNESAPTPFTDVWDPISIPMPANAVVGIGTIYGNAFNTWVSNGGVPYCPEKFGKFEIAKPKST